MAMYGDAYGYYIINMRLSPSWLIDKTLKLARERKVKLYKHNWNEIKVVPLE